MSGKTAENIIIKTSVGAGLGILVSALIIIIIAAILAIGDIPAMLISPITVLALALGGFSGGFLSAKFSEEKGLLYGSISGLIFFIIILLINVFSGKPSFGTGMIIKFAMIIMASSFGGIIGVNTIKIK